MSQKVRFCLAVVLLTLATALVFMAVVPPPRLLSATLPPAGKADRLGREQVVQQALTPTVASSMAYLPVIVNGQLANDLAAEPAQPSIDNAQLLFLPVAPNAVEPAQHDAVKPAQMQSGTAVTNRPWEQRHPALAYDATGGQYLVVWEDQFNNSADYDVFARRLDAGGAPDGDERRIAYTTDTERNPAVAANAGAGEYLIVWETINGATNAHAVLAQRTGSSGDVVGSPLVIDGNCGYQDCEPDVVYNGVDGVYLVVWLVWDPDGATVNAQLVSASGTLLGATQLEGYGQSLAYPQVVHNATLDQYMIVWAQSVLEESGYATDVYAIRADAAAAPLDADPFAVSTAAHDQIAPRLAWNTALGDYLVVWEDHRAEGSSDSAIYGQRLSGYGALIGENFRISEDTVEQRFKPDVAYKPEANEFIVVWTYEFSPADLDVQMRRVSYYGALLDRESTPAGSTAIERNAVVAEGMRKNYLSVWEDGRNLATQGMDLYDALAAVDVFRGMFMTAPRATRVSHSQASSSACIAPTTTTH